MPCPIFSAQYADMLKTISTEQVTLGMHIHELKGAWIDHPFWKTKFVLTEPADLHKLKHSVIKQVIIDASKGLDVAVIEDEAVHEEVETAPVEMIVQSSPDEKQVRPQAKRVSTQQEFAQANRIIKESEKAVSSMFTDVRMGKVVRGEDLMPVVDEITASIRRNESALISLVRLKSKDDYTYMHSVAVCAMMTALARELGLSETETKQAGLAGLMHDLGKATISLDILNKPGALTDREFDLVKKHPEQGHALLLQAEITDPVTLDVCLHHHEKIDGSGYPKALKADQISLFAKMGAVCDVYDAVTSNRPYKAGWEPGMSIKRMAQWKGHFEPNVLAAFVKSIGIYPVGSVVILKSGRLAVVIDQTPQTLLQPIVKVFFSTKSKSRIPLDILDLSKPNANDEIVGNESAETWQIHNVHEIWTSPE